MSEGEVRHEEAQTRYVIEAGGAIAVAGYRRVGNVLSFTHTEVPEELEGQGIASRLVGGALEDVRGHGWKIVPLCSFVRHYVETHPETQDLLD